MESAVLRLRGPRGASMSAPRFSNNLREDLDCWRCSWVPRTLQASGRTAPLGVTETTERLVVSFLASVRTDNHADRVS